MEKRQMNRILTAAALVAITAFSAAPSFAAAAAATTMKPAAMAPAKVAMAPAKPAMASKATPLTFKLIDANHDGKITFAELKKYFPKVTKAEFAKFAGKDGTLDHAGLAAFAAAEKAMMAPMAAAKPAMAPAKPAMAPMKPMMAPKK
jgi:hypothetical protein